MNTGPKSGGDPIFALRVAVAVGIGLTMVSVLALLWLALDVLLLGFAGVLVAVMLRGMADWLARHSFLGERWSLLIVILVLASLVGAAAWLAATPVVKQFDTLTTLLPVAAESIQKHLRAYEWGDWLIRQTSSIDWMSRRINLLGKMTGALSTAFGAVVNVVVIGFLGLYLAVQPRVYLNGILRLLPVGRRQRINEVLREIGRTLQWWMIGTACAMSVIGVVSGVGLWLLNIPFALALGVTAGVLSFVPYLGAIVSAIPAMAVAITHGPQYALYVAALYLGIHILEGYLVSPLVQQYAVSLPPALLLFAQIMLGLLVGGMGVVLAAPIAAVAMVAIKMLYVHDVLEDEAP